MAERGEVNKALEILRDRRPGKNGYGRTHSNAMQDNVDRRRALEGLCGRCPALIIDFNETDGKQSVSLRCLKGFKPLMLYYNTPIGKEAKCKGFSESGN